MIKVIEENVKKENNEVKVGDLVRWLVASEEEAICIVTSENLVSLENPNNTWGSCPIMMYIEQNIKCGNLKRLPSGTKVTVEYIQD